jgi:N-acetylmuramoyl-L-alanine amidase
MMIACAPFYSVAEAAPRKLKITSFITNVRYCAVPQLYPDGKNRLTFSFAANTAVKARIQICVKNTWASVYTAKQAAKKGSFDWDGYVYGKALSPRKYKARIAADYRGRFYAKTLTVNILKAPPVLRVFLSPSMQQGNIGAGDYGTEEQRMNEIADVVQQLLSDRGITIYRNDPAWDVKKAVAFANQKNCQAYVAIHSNAMGRKKDSGTAKGCEVWVRRKGSAGAALADIVYRKMGALTPVKDRGVKTGKLYEATYPKAPACLVEVDFHDNPERAKWITAHIEDIGAAIAQGICGFLNVTYGD